PPPCFNISKKQIYVRLPTTNDCDNTNFCGSAQNTTSIKMAQFFLNILLKKTSILPLIKEMNDDMYKLLQRAQQANDSAFVSRVTAIPLLFDGDAVKIGQGPLKVPGPRGSFEARSEGIIIKWKIPDAATRKKWDDLNLTGEAAICWQNIVNVDAFSDGMA